MRNSPTTTNRPEHPPDPARPDVGGDGQNDGVEPGEQNAVDLGRIAWLGTVVVCMIVVLIVAVQGYYGYAAVTLAVALAAGINLV